MKKRILLSICIPTYKRPVYTLETLESIAPQMSEAVELVICDDNSRDGTLEVIRLFKSAHPELNIRIFDNDPNIGFDRNVLRVMSKATGKYAWLFGNDDVLLPGAVKRITKIISSGKMPTLVHVNYSRYDDILKKVNARKMVGSISKDLRFYAVNDFYFKKVTKSYFKFLGTNTITMSTDIILKKAWDTAAKETQNHIGHNFIHSFVIGNAIMTNPNIYYVAKPLVQYRANNHRLWPNDIWKDYNTVLLDYLKAIGYSNEKIDEMKKAQKVYEQRESAMKNNYLSIIFRYARPVIAGVRLIKDKY